MFGIIIFTEKKCVQDSANKEPFFNASILSAAVKHALLTDDNAPKSEKHLITLQYGSAVSCLIELTSSFSVLDQDALHYYRRGTS